MKTIKKLLKREEGFTLVELGVVVPMLIATVLTLIATLFFALGMGIKSKVEVESSTDISIALNTIENDVLYTTSFLTTIDNGVFDPYKPNPTWEYKGSGPTRRNLILRTYATHGHPEDPDRSPVFINQYGCAANLLYYNISATYNVVYFVKNNNLYRRKLMDPSLIVCNTPNQKLSCPSLEDLGTASRSYMCKANDELLVRGVEEFSVDYYDSAGDSAPNASYTHEDGVLTSSAIKVKIKTKRKGYNTDVTASSSLLMSRMDVRR